MTIETNFFPAIILFVAFWIMVCVHINIAINLFMFSRETKKESNVQVLFVHPILIGFVGLIFGLIASIAVRLLYQNKT